jgi:hypothetical protein
MGLRLVAHYYDRNEALIVSAAVDAAGIPNFLENAEQNSVQPFYQVALGGFRLMVCEQDLHDALAIIEEARRNPVREGERLSQRTYPLSSLMLFLVIGVPLPFRTSTWRDHQDRT